LLDLTAHPPPVRLPRLHRNFRISGDVQVLRDLARRLEPLAEIITLALDEDGALKPRGGVLAVQALNRSADSVLLAASQAAQQGKIVIEIGSSSSLVDTVRQEQIDHDADEMLWEEMEQNLRNQGRLSPNALVLMALGGACAAAGVTQPTLMQVTAFVAASIIAPGFDSIAAIALGTVLRRWRVVRRAALSTLVGYVALFAAAALTYFLMRAPAPGNDGVVQLLSLEGETLVIAGSSAVAGAIMIVSLRDIYVVGALIGLVLVPTAALAGCAAATGAWDMVWKALRLVLLDGALVVVASALVFWLKQRTVHRRLPLD
jgi:hypothetical protein